MKKIFFFLFFLAFVQYSEAQFFLPKQERDSINRLAEVNHRQMMDQLHITELRAGPSGDPNAPNHANYDESKANPCPQLPDILTSNSGKKVNTPEMWRKERRPEIVKGLEEEVYGKIPANVPKVIKYVSVQYQVCLSPKISICSLKEATTGMLFNENHAHIPTKNKGII